MNFQWHKLQKQKQRTNMTDITNFSDREKQTLYNQEIQNNVQPSVATSPQEQWTYIADVCKDTGKEILGHKERKHKINDPELKELSQKSHKLHLDISASKDKNKRANLRAERKRTIKLIRKKISNHQSQVIEEKLQQLETFKDDSNRYYQVLRSINNNKRKQPLCVQYEDGNIVSSEKDQADIISHHFCQLLALRRGRSTADVVFGYRWLCAKAQRQRVTIEFLCIDLSRAFDTIRRDKLLEVLQSFLDEPELRMIRFLLAATSLEPRLSTGECHAFASTIGTPQGDSLSPVLFTVYLEAALRDLRSRLPPRPPADAKLPLDVEYADDIDFISYSRPYLNEIERIAPVCLGEWSLQINAAKTERTSVSRQVDRTHEPWRTTRKLGSLLGEVEDVTRRMQLANVSFHKMWTVWFRGAQISLLLRLRLYSAFVLPVLTYNMGTWGLTKTELSRLDAHHRRHLRQIIGIRWPHRISNDALYRRTHSSPISAAIRAARWSLFGHVLRLPLDAPVQRAIDAYLEDTGTPKFRGRPRCTLATTLGENLRRIGRQLRNSDDIDALRTLDRSTWRDIGREMA